VPDIVIGCKVLRSYMNPLWICSRWLLVITLASEGIRVGCFAPVCGVPWCRTLAWLKASKDSPEAAPRMLLSDFCSRQNSPPLILQTKAEWKGRGWTSRFGWRHKRARTYGVPVCMSSRESNSDTPRSSVAGASSANAKWRQCAGAIIFNRSLICLTWGLTVLSHCLVFKGHKPLRPS